jgi:hypothetical protein
MTMPAKSPATRTDRTPSAGAREAGLVPAEAELVARRVAELLGERLAPAGALRRMEAARYLAVSDETFDRYVRPHLRVVRLGSVRVYPRANLDAFMAERASSPLEDVA